MSIPRHIDAAALVGVTLERSAGGGFAVRVLRDPAGASPDRASLAAAPAAALFRECRLLQAAQSARSPAQAASATLSLSCEAMAGRLGGAASGSLLSVVRATSFLQLAELALVGAGALQAAARRAPLCSRADVAGWLSALRREVVRLQIHVAAGAPPGQVDASRAHIDAERARIARAVGLADDAGFEGVGVAAGLGGSAVNVSASAHLADKTARVAAAAASLGAYSGALSRLRLMADARFDELEDGGRAVREWGAPGARAS
jgi:hypothetical protein